MKLKYVLLVCYVTCISSTNAAFHAFSEPLAKKPTPAVKPDVAKTKPLADDKLIKTDVKSEHLKEMSEETDVPIKLESQETAKLTIKGGNETDVSVTELKDILGNVTKASNITDDEDVETSTPYDVKHYLTAEQKYYMLRINLLGIGIRVVHDIIPIPVINTNQYKESMEALLDKVQAAREASHNITGEKMQNITLENAHKLQMKMTETNETESSGPIPTKSKSRTTEVMVLVGAVGGIILVGVLIFVCKRSACGKSDESSYYDRMQGGGGGVPMN